MSVRRQHHLLSSSYISGFIGRRESWNSVPLDGQRAAILFGDRSVLNPN
jgi:hypothetical protein